MLLLTDGEDNDSFIIHIVLNIVTADGAALKFDVDVDDNDNDNDDVDNDGGDGGDINRAYLPYIQVLYVASINIVTVKR